jgi:hypothetical protein
VRLLRADAISISSGQKQFTLDPGGKSTLSLNGSGVIPSTSAVGTRFEVGGLVLVSQWTEGANPCVSFFQVYENSTGITTLYFLFLIATSSVERKTTPPLLPSGLPERAFSPWGIVCYQ